MYQALTLHEDPLGSEIEAHWFAAYTRPRHEKAVADQLSKQVAETYLPLYSVIRFWNTRRVVVELPLFPGYVFIKMSFPQKRLVLSHPGVIRLVTCSGKAISVSDSEIEQLRCSLTRWRAEPYPLLKVGKQVEIRSGPFAGLKGRIIRRKSKMGLVVSIDLIQGAFALQLDATEAQLVS